MELFRRAAIDHKRMRILGNRKSGLPIFVHALVVGISVLAAASVALSFTVQVPRSRTVQGNLNTIPEPVYVYAGSGGRVHDKYFAEGDLVAAGDTLFVVQPTILDTEGTRLSAATLSELRSRREGVIAQEEQEDRLYQQRRLRLDSEISERAGRAPILDRQLALLRDQATVADQLYERMSRLESEGAVSTSDLATRRAASISARSAVLGLQATINTERGSLDRLHIDRSILDAERRLRAMESESLVSEMSGQIATAQVEDSRSYFAPIAGAIAHAPVEVGDSVSPDQILAIIRRSDSHPVVELYVPSESIGNIEVGQVVRVEVTAFPARRYGYLTGEIRLISGVELPASELPQSMQNSENIYRILVYINEPQQQTSTNLLNQVRPGMSAVSRIQYAQTSIARWIFDSITGDNAQ